MRLRHVLELDSRRLTIHDYSWAEKFGAIEAHRIVRIYKLAGPDEIGLQCNTAMYISPSTDLEWDGPTVIDVPPGTLGAKNKVDLRYAGDFDPAGQDNGGGGKYLILPPGYKGDMLEGYFIFEPRSYKHWILLRHSLADGMENAANSIKEHLDTYPLSAADNPRKRNLSAVWSKPGTACKPILSPTTNSMKSFRRTRLISLAKKRGDCWLPSAWKRASPSVPTCVCGPS